MPQIVTLRVYGTYAQANMRKYIAAHMQVCTSYTRLPVTSHGVPCSCMEVQGQVLVFNPFCDSFRALCTAGLQGTHWSFPQTGLVARYHFTNDFSSTRGHLASKTHQVHICSTERPLCICYIIQTLFRCSAQFDCAVDHEDCHRSSSQLIERPMHLT